MAESQCLYLLTAAISLYLFIIFLWWWIKLGDATYIYRITCLLMFGIFFRNATTFYVLSDNRIDAAEYQLLQSHFWHGRLLLVIVPLLLYAFYVTRRIMSYYRRRNGK